MLGRVRRYVGNRLLRASGFRRALWRRAWNATGRALRLRNDALAAWRFTREHPELTARIAWARVAADRPHSAGWTLGIVAGIALARLERAKRLRAPLKAWRLARSYGGSRRTALRCALGQIRAFRGRK